VADALTNSQQIDDSDGSYSEGGEVTLKKTYLQGSHMTSKGFLALAEVIAGVAGSTSTLKHLDLGHTIDIAEDVDVLHLPCIFCHLLLII